VIRVELSVDTLSGAAAAAAVGADRIELCGAGSEGGLTPGHGLVEQAVRRCATPVHVLVRPRAGDFVYSAAEVDAMVADITHAVELGAAGVVAGVLTPHGWVDQEATARLVAASGDREFTFHRAIDVCADPVAALDVLGGLGVDRVLTSGATPTALRGLDVLAELVRRAKPGTSVMACGGVRPGNLVDVVTATGVSDVHAAPRRPVRGMASDIGFAEWFELDERVAAELVAIRNSVTAA
jgi:copper homeostasis protein